MQLTTRRLLLREHRLDDWRAVLAYQSDPRYLRFYHWAHRTEDDVRAFVREFVDQQHRQPRLRYSFAVVLAATDRLIGNCNIRLDSADAHEGEIGYELAPDEWGQGYATEAARAILAFGFDALKLHRISAHCIADNVGSARVLEKIGMQQEGRLRSKEWIKGRYWDVLLYAILRDDWAAGRET